MQVIDEALLAASCKQVLLAEGKVAGGVERVVNGGVEHMLAGGAKGEAPDDLAGVSVTVLGMKEQP